MAGSRTPLRREKALSWSPNSSLTAPDAACPITLLNAGCAVVMTWMSIDLARSKSLRDHSIVEGLAPDEKEDDDRGT